MRLVAEETTQSCGSTETRVIKSPQKKSQKTFYKGDLLTGSKMGTIFDQRKKAAGMKLQG